MAIEITVPRLGWSAEEAIFAGWLKRPGETVMAGEPLYALESEKVTMEVESLDGGVLELVEGGPVEGALVTVGQVVGRLLQAGEKADAVAVSRRRPVSPRARARAKSLGLDLDGVQAAPGAARVVEADVLRAAQGRPAPGRGRRAIAARMEESFRVPHFYVHAEADATAFAKLREELTAILAERQGPRVTYNDLLVKAAALALRAVPALNCYWNDGEAASLETANIGLAVQAGERLLVPVIREADRRTVAEIAEERERLVERCKRGALQPGDMEAGSMTISNLGAFGVDRFQAILNPPQSAILAVGRVAKRPFVDGDAVVARLTVALSLSVDHRVVDGVVAARFLGELVRLVQVPLRIIL